MRDINAERFSLVRISATLRVAKQEAQLLRPFSDSGALNRLLGTGLRTTRSKLTETECEASFPSLEKAAFL